MHSSRNSDPIAILLNVKLHHAYTIYAQIRTH